MKTVHLPPPSSGFYLSLRGNSHTLATALSDLIDNAYSAGARNIWIAGAWRDGQPTIEVLDDGHGMARDVLIYQAMKFTAGEQIRGPKDLGKFGLGLKIAAFSQGECLTLISKRDGIVSSARWDGKALGADWTLQVDVEYESSPFTERLATMKSGTIVRISDIDRLGPTGPEASKDEFTAAIMETERHIARTFNRLIDDGLNIYLGRKLIGAEDPVLADELSTQRMPPVFPKIGKSLKIEGFVVSPDHDLPHSEQGVLLYRNHRLIATAGWCGLSKLGNHDVLTRLARVVIDISADDDLAWGINVEKSTFRVPSQVKSILRDRIEATQAESRRILEKRHGRASKSPRETGNDLWMPTGLVMQPYAINFASGVIADLMAGRQRKSVEEALRLAQRHLPPYASQQGHILETESGEDSSPEPIDEVVCNIPTEMIEQVKFVIAFNRENGCADDEIARRLSTRLGSHIEPRLVTLLAGQNQ
ncbi:ATP-binding protein [Agrobacterium salinitolerans]|nr:ATP-binding protein [Agrobacterium salinitolerans]